MTKEQAIEVLHELDGSLYETQQVALDMAIKALEQQASDCVSLEVYKQVAWERDIAIEQLKELGYSFGEKIRTCEDCVSREQAKIDVIPNSLYTSEQVIALLDNLPLVTPTQSWIPVSERVPTEEEYIANNGLFIVSDGNRTYSEYFDIYNSKKYFGEPTMNGFRVDRCVIAWQPLPQPYEEK